MQRVQTNLGEQNSPQIFFASKQEKIDYETGQYASFRMLKLEDNPFRLPSRRLAWSRGFRDATYENEQRSAQTVSESTHGHIANLRSRLR